MLTPESVHYGEADSIIQARAATLQAAFDANPKRFKGKCPIPESPPREVWINPPKADESATVASPNEIIIESKVLGKTETGTAGEQPVKG